MTQSVGAAGTRNRLSGALAKTFLATLVANLPMFGLLLVPQLMRSRAGSERLLLIGSALYLALIAVALTISPWVSAWAAPRSNLWTPHAVRQTVYRIRRSRAREFWQRLAEWLLLFCWPRPSACASPGRCGTFGTIHNSGRRANRGGSSTTATTRSKPSQSICSVVYPSPGSVRACANLLCHAERRYADSDVPAQDATPTKVPNR
jgi:hypothetical protein